MFVTNARVVRVLVIVKDPENVGFVRNVKVITAFRVFLSSSKANYIEITAIYLPGIKFL